MAGLDSEKYEVIAPEDIRAEKITITYLILRQIDRINTLLTLGIASTDEKKTNADVTAGTLFGMRSIEAMMLNDLFDDEKYFDAVKLLKQNLPRRLDATTDPDNSLMKWYDLLVRKMTRVGIIPAKKVTYHFAEKGWEEKK